MLVFRCVGSPAELSIVDEDNILLQELGIESFLRTGACKFARSIGSSQTELAIETWLQTYPSPTLDANLREQLFKFAFRFETYLANLSRHIGQTFMSDFSSGGQNSRTVAPGMLHDAHR